MFEFRPVSPTPKRHRYVDKSLAWSATGISVSAILLGANRGLRSEFTELRILLANGVVGWRSLENPLLVIAGFGK